MLWWEWKGEGWFSRHLVGMAQITILCILLIQVIMHDICYALTNISGQFKNIHYLERHVQKLRTFCYLNCWELSLVMLMTITNGMYSCAVSFDKDACEFSQKSIDDETIYHVTYDGTPIDPLLCSKMTFFGRDSSHINTYRVCVSLLSYQDPDCAIWFGYILTSGQIEARNNVHVWHNIHFL